MFNISFWNCGLAPLKNSTIIEDNAIIVKDIIISIFEDEDLSVHFLILCEVNQSAIYLIKKLISESSAINLSYMPYVSRASTHASFDMLIIFKSSHCNIPSDISAIKYNTNHPTKDDFLYKDGTTTKAGIFIEVNVTGENERLYIIASHWPSDAFPTGKEKRAEAARKIKSVSDSHIESGKQLLLIGDYNTPPHATVLRETMSVKHSKIVAIKSSYNLYNASFNLMKPHVYHSKATANERLSYGTYIWKNNHDSEDGCAILDQVLVSSHFISEGPWHLVESNVKYIYNSLTEKYIDYKNQLIDHLPIYVSVEK